MIKLLDLSYKDDIKKITLSHNTLSGVTADQINATNFWMEDEVVNLYLNPDNSTHLCWGYFENDQLISFLNMQFSITRPVWYLQKIVNDAEASSSMPMKGLGSLISHAIQYAEQRYVFEFYTSVPVRWMKAAAKTWWDNAPEVRRNTIVIDCVVPAKQRPAYDEFWVILMKSTLWPADMAIRHHMLKPEYRPSVDQLKMLYSSKYQND